MEDKQPADVLKKLREAEKALRDSEERRRAIFEQSPLGVLVMDPETGTAVEFNDTVHKQLGYSRSEFAGLSIFDYEVMEKPEEIRMRTENILLRGREDFETLHRTKEGETRNVMVTMQTIELEGKPFLHSIYHDITGIRRSEKEIRELNATLEQKVVERTVQLEGANKELEKANEKLKEVDRMKSMFIATMSHELRTPLNSIIGFSSILQNEWAGPLNAEQKENISIVLRAGRHLLALINDVIDVSKIEAGRIETINEMFDLHDAVDEVVMMLQKEIREKGLELKVETTHVKMNTDRRRLIQCVMNLVSNAMKYTERGCIFVGAGLAPAQKQEGQSQGSPLRDFIEILVEDTGIGIKEEDMSRLFKSFIRLDSSLTAKVRGTGLGLYLTKKLVTDVLKGEMAATSEYGKGSRFVMRMPVSSESGIKEGQG